MTQVAIILTQDELQSIVRDEVKRQLESKPGFIQAVFRRRVARASIRTGFFISQKPCAACCAVCFDIALKAPQSGRFFIFKKK